MNRLTKKFNGEYYRKDADTIMFNSETDYNAIQKLGKLEDIEEELGCPLGVVFKALKDGIKYEVKITSVSTKDNFKTKDIRIEQRESIKVIKLINDVFRGNQFVLIVPYDTSRYGCKEDVVYLKDYQKTWWLKGEK